MHVIWWLIFYHMIYIDLQIKRKDHRVPCCLVYYINRKCRRSIFCLIFLKLIVDCKTFRRIKVIKPYSTFSMADLLYTTNSKRVGVGQVSSNHISHNHISHNHISHQTSSHIYAYSLLWFPVERYCIYCMHIILLNTKCLVDIREH